MAGAVDVLIEFRGPGSLEQPTVAPPKPKVVHTTHMYERGDEIVRFHPGWFVHEVTIKNGMVTWIVELRRPGWDRQPGTLDDAEIDDESMSAQ